MPTVLSYVTVPPSLICSQEPFHFMDAVREFEVEFLRIFPGAELVASSHLEAKRFLVRLYRQVYRFLPRGLLASRCPSTKGAFQMSVQMGPDFGLVIPFFFLSRPNFIYMFDAWPRYMPWIIDFVDDFNVQTIFFSSRQSCEMYNKLRGSTARQGQWLPEGISPDDYIGLPQEQKVIDVLEFGRRNEVYHDQICEGLKDAKVTHLFAKTSEPLFASKREFCRALSQAKICICFPSSITHPQRAEGISTLTLRYLQAMLSRCLVVGEAPVDISETFGYNPVISYDPKDPVGQILDIIHNIDKHLSLVERNLKAVLSGHLWRHRLEGIRPILLSVW